MEARRQLTEALGVLSAISTTATLPGALPPAVTASEPAARPAAAAWVPIRIQMEASAKTFSRPAAQSVLHSALAQFGMQLAAMSVTSVVSAMSAVTTLMGQSSAGAVAVLLLHQALRPTLLDYCVYFWLSLYQTLNRIRRAFSDI